MVHAKPVQTCRVTRPRRLLPTFQQQAWKARQHVMGLESLETDLEKAMCEAVKMKPTLQWRCQDLGRAAKKSCRPDNEWRHSRMRTCGEQMARLKGGAGQAHCCSCHDTASPAAGHVGTGLNACLPASQAQYDAILPYYCPVPSWNRNICCVPLNIECNLSLIFFQRISQQRVSGEPRLRLLSNVRAINIWRLLETN